MCFYVSENVKDVDTFIVCFVLNEKVYKNRSYKVIGLYEATYN